MLHEKNKIDSVMAELMRYVLQSHPTRVVLTVEDLGDRIRITVESHGARVSNIECQLEQNLLNAPVPEELREYYRGLAGEETTGPCDLRVAALMVDGGAVEPIDDGMRIVVWWRSG
jgi:uncharacterized protein YuzE